MKYDVRSCAILRMAQIAPGFFDMTVDAGLLAQIAQPGQFAQILVPGKTLRRPISICRADGGSGIMRFVFQVRGEGTAVLAEKQQGESVDILAPLGHGFSLSPDDRDVLLVGGGIGVPPLLWAANNLGQNAGAVLGFRDRQSVILENDFRAAGCRVEVATDDGSYGYHGVVTGLLPSFQPKKILACGPAPMLRAIAAWAEERNIPCQVSLEQRMACGIGACLGCACKLRRDGREVYGHVCKDGPVFDSKSVVWEE